MMHASHETPSTSGYAGRIFTSCSRPKHATFRRTGRSSRRKHLRRHVASVSESGKLVRCYANWACVPSFVAKGLEGEAVALAQAIDALDAGKESTAADTEVDHDEKVHPVLLQPAHLRQLSSSGDAPTCFAAFLELSESGGHMMALTEADCMTLMAAAFDRGNVDLALSVYDAMGRTPGAASASLGVAPATEPQLGWPPATIKSTELLVLLLARELRVSDALAVIAKIRSRGLPRNDEVPFGLVIDSPLAPGKPLTVVLPQEGASVVACATSRFEFETFSGTVTEAKSEALNSSSNFFISAVLRRSPCQAVHELVVRTPDGMARTFRIGTDAPDIPAQVGERVSIVASPSKGAPMKKGGLLSSRPPGTRAGEPLTITNHATGITTRTRRPPTESTGLPTWFVPVVAVLVAGDAGSALIDPAYPLLIVGGAATAVSSLIGGNAFLIPKWKQLPENALASQEMKQRLLTQHSSLMTKTRDLTSSLSEDVMSLARLWQLQAKMQVIGAADTYNARLDRVIKARSELEEATRKRLSLLESYSRIANMIEIEVEMNVQVPKSELNDIDRQISELAEAEKMQKDWQRQVEAEDELERILGRGDE